MFMNEGKVVKELTKPTIKTGETISSIEFPPLTKEDLEEIFHLYLSLYRFFTVFNKRILGLKEYAGIDTEVGTGRDYFNSITTLRQLIYAMAMTRHSLIKNMVKEIDERNFDASKFNAKVLVENQIMAGMKILDLGCGHIPVFARCCRAMGADVWTVDICAANEFISKKESFSTEQQDLEKTKHIFLNLKSSEDANAIIKKSLGNFNLVTQANSMATFINGSTAKSMALSLLKKGGVYQDPVYNPRGILKE